MTRSSGVRSTSSRTARRHRYPGGGRMSEQAGHPGATAAIHGGGRRRVAVLGAGMAGLVAAYRLARIDAEVDVYERWPGLGGQVATVDIGAAEPVERYYHHLFTS